MTKYSYTTFSPVTAVDNTAGLIPDHTQSVTYNAWGRVSEISYVSGGDTYQYTITYGPDPEDPYILAAIHGNRFYRGLSCYIEPS